MELLPILMMGGGAFLVLVMMVLAFSGPSAARASTRRLSGLRERHLISNTGATAMDAQIRRVTNARATGMDLAASRFLPNPALLQKRLNMTGKSWTLSQYTMVSGGLTLLLGGGLYLWHCSSRVECRDH